MPFLGAEMALPCVGGRRFGIFPAPGSSGQNRRASGKRYSGAILDGILSACGGRRQTAPLLDLGTRLSPLMQLVPDICWAMVSDFGRHRYYPIGHLWPRHANSLNAARFKQLPHSEKDSHERKSARRRTHDYELFFVETVPKRYTFGTETPPKWLDLAWLEPAPKRGCSDKTLIRPAVTGDRQRRNWLVVMCLLVVINAGSRFSPRLVLQKPASSDSDFAQVFAAPIVVVGVIESDTLVLGPTRSDGVSVQLRKLKTRAEMFCGGTRLAKPSSSITSLGRKHSTALNHSALDGELHLQPPRHRIANLAPYSPMSTRSSMPVAG